jgi:hypothetical protein
MASKGIPIGKIVVFVIAAGVAWRWGGPLYRKYVGGGEKGTATPGKSGGGDGIRCADLADRASSTWGGGVGRFVNPPYDQGAWDRFKGDVDGRISEARSACGCSADSCRKGSDALSELESIVSQVDSAVRNGGSISSDVVRQQEKVDGLINEAREMARGGK